MRVETKLRHSVPQKSQDENRGLRTERQIELYRRREAAKRERAERCEVEARAREAEARVRHLNFELVQRGVLLVMGVVIGIAIVFGAGIFYMARLARAGPPEHVEMREPSLDERPARPLSGAQAHS